MRIIWLTLVPVVLGAASTGYAQDARTRKAKARSGDVWAVAHVEQLPVQTLPLAQPTVQYAPQNQHPAPLALPTQNHHPVPVAQPMHVAPVPHEANCHDKGHGKRCSLLDFFCFRRTRCCKGDGPCYFCHRPLYAYFLGQCREGACHTGLPCSSNPCPKVGCWGKCFQTGHAMYAMPTGHGACGVR